MIVHHHRHIGADHKVRGFFLKYIYTLSQFRNRNSDWMKDENSKLTGQWTVFQAKYGIETVTLGVELTNAKVAGNQLPRVATWTTIWVKHDIDSQTSSDTPQVQDNTTTQHTSYFNYTESSDQLTPTKNRAKIRLPVSPHSAQYGTRQVLAFMYFPLKSDKNFNVWSQKYNGYDRRPT